MNDQSKTSGAMVLVLREAFQWAVEQLEEDGNKGTGYFETLSRSAEQAPALGGEHGAIVGSLERFESEGEDYVKLHDVRDAVQVIIAPLQADLKSAIADKEAYGQNAIDLRKQVDQLTARRNALEGLLQMFIDNSDDRDVVEISRHALSKPAGSEQALPLEIPSRTITLSGCEFTEDELLRRAVRAVRGNRRNTYPRWALVRDAFGCGSGVGTALCRRFGFDPEEILKS